MEIPGLLNNTTENLEQKKIISWAPVDQATDESSGPNQLKLIALGRGHHRVWPPIHQTFDVICAIERPIISRRRRPYIFGSWLTYGRRPLYSICFLFFRPIISRHRRPYRFRFFY